MKYWLVKSEPSAYSFDQLVKDKKTGWEGIRSYAARNNLRSMGKNDQVLFYHSNEGKEIIGIAKVVKTSYQDPTTDDPNWLAVDIAAVKKLKKPVTLLQVKADPELKEFELIRLSRLSVSAVSEKEWKHIMKLAGE